MRWNSSHFFWWVWQCCCSSKSSIVFWFDLNSRDNSPRRKAISSLRSFIISMFMHSCAVSPFRLDEYTLSVCVIASNVDYPSVWVSRVTKENQSRFGNSVWVSALLVMFACLVSVSRACTRASTTSNFWNESKPFGVFLFTVILVSS